MAWAFSTGMIRSRESKSGRASSGPTSPRHPVIGSKRTRPTRVRPGRRTGCRTSLGSADPNAQIGARKSSSLIEFRNRGSANGENGIEKPGQAEKLNNGWGDLFANTRRTIRALSSDLFAWAGLRQGFVLRTILMAGICGSHPSQNQGRWGTQCCGGLGRGQKGGPPASLGRKQKGGPPADSARTSLLPEIPIICIYAYGYAPILSGV